MTKRQLQVFFEHFNIPPQYDDLAINDLKKAIQLELKSTADDVLVIEAREWSKNDILEFFNQPLEEGFDEIAFYTKYPWAKAIVNPGKINYYKYLEDLEFPEHDFVEFRRKEAVNYEKVFLDELRNDMKVHRDLAVAAMLCYLKCFRSEFQFAVLDTARSMMYTRLNNAQAEIESSGVKAKLSYIKFMQHNAYYWVLAKLGDSDSDLILLNLQVFGQGMAGNPVDPIIEIVRKQKQLQHSPEGIAFLNKVYSDLVTLQSKNSSSGNEGWGAGRIAVTAVLMIVIAIARLSRHHSTPDYSMPVNIQSYPYAYPGSTGEIDSSTIIMENDTLRSPLDSSSETIITPY